jgi:hypothetical protein
MKKFKTIILTATVAALAAFSSCTKDPCETVTCQNGGATKKVNTDSCGCNCTFGYTGASCENVDLTKLVGSYSMTQTGSASGAHTFTIGVANPSTGTVSISGFWNNTFINSVVATVSGSKLTIARQAPDADGFYVVGTADVSFNSSNKPVLVFTYTVTKEVVAGTITATDAITSATATGL